MKHRSKRRGFSLMELLISIGIIATALLLVIGVLTFLFSASQKGVDLTAGTVVAESILQKEVSEIFAQTSTQQEAFFAYPHGTEYKLEDDVKKLNQAEFFYTIYASDMSGLGATKLKKLSIVCRWWDKGGGLPGASRTGYGLLTVELSRLLCEKGNY